MMDYNFHAHTTRCGHATGKMEDYVLRAIEGGIRVMGFSDHVPLRFADGTESGHRIPVAQAQDYYDDFITLREKYKDKIELHIGFEVEYYPAYFEKTLADARELGIEYFILGQHFLSEENQGGINSFAMHSDPAVIERFVSVLIAAMQTGRFTYVAHPDLLGFEGDASIYARQMERLCLASREMDVPLEINLYGIRAKRRYPEERFWEIAGRIGAPVTFGCDAHSADAAADPDSEAVAMRLVEKYGLNYIGKPKIVDIRKKG